MISQNPKMHDMSLMTEYDDFVCSAMIAPKDTAEAQTIVRWAH